MANENTLPQDDNLTADPNYVAGEMADNADGEITDPNMTATGAPQPEESRAEAELADLKDKYLRLAAEFEKTYGVRQALISDITWVTEGVHAGQGCAISLRDSLIPRRVFVDRIRAIAADSGIAHQLEVEGSGGSDAKELQHAAAPWDWCFVGAPEDHVHSPNELVVKRDIESMLALYQVLLREL